MGDVDTICKWDLDEEQWSYNVSCYERGRSCSFVNYDQFIDNGNLDYLIFIDGTRVEDHSSDYKTVSIRESGVDKIISFFENRNKKVLVKLFLMDADAPIIEESKLFARYLDFILKNRNVHSMNVIGLSKGGALIFNTPKYLKNKDSFDKTNIYTVATPFEGTKIASPKLFSNELRQIINSRCGDNKVSNLVYNKLLSFYESVSSNSHMDYDIATLWSIPIDKVSLYDPLLIKNMFSDDNIESIQKINSYKNVVTGINDDTLKESIKNFDFTGIGLCILDDLFFDKKSDGLVMSSSQRIVEKKIPDLKSEMLLSSHHAITRNNRVMDDLLNIVDEQIDLSYEERGKVFQKKLF